LIISNSFLALDGTTESVLLYDSRIEVTVQKGTPSAEGPLTTAVNQSFSFRTFGEMKFVKSSCSGICSPFDDWYLEFTNPIDQSSFDPSMVKISPSIENIQIHSYGHFIYVSGYKRGRTSYTVTIDSSLIKELKSFRRYSGAEFISFLITHVQPHQENL
jgi:hypothetical protein